MAAGVLEYAIMAAYETLVASFVDAVDKADCGFVKAKPILGCFKREWNGTVTFDSCLHLQNWGKKPQLSILVRAQETIRPGGALPILESSTVHVSYFKIEQDTAALLHSIHFDFDGEKDLHPVFHAQLCPETIQLSANDAEALEFSFSQDFAKAICFKDARIPTPDMTFPSVLLCLAADHMPTLFFREFMESVRGIHKRMPLPPFENLKKSIAKEPGHLRSFHWFAHMEEPSP
ncbi:MAG: hypothetical protein ACLQVM_10245 [Terriglobia bacterium]